MAPSKPTPEPAEADGTPEDKAPPAEKKPNADQIATARVVDVAAEKRQRAEDLEAARQKLLAQLAEVNAVAEAEGLGSDVKPTHLLVLANGDRVESSGAIPTHHGTEGGPAVLVVQAFELEGLS
jgi:hypothetical protein